MYRVVSKNLNNYYIFRKYNNEMVVGKLRVIRKVDSEDVGYLVDKYGTVFKMPLEKITLHRIIISDKILDTNMNSLTADKIYQM